MIELRLRLEEPNDMHMTLPLNHKLHILTNLHIKINSNLWILLIQHSNNILFSIFLCDKSRLLLKNNLILYWWRRSKCNITYTNNITHCLIYFFCTKNEGVFAGDYLPEEHFLGLLIYYIRVLLYFLWFWFFGIVKYFQELWFGWVGFLGDCFIFWIFDNIL